MEKECSEVCFGAGARGWQAVALRYLTVDHPPPPFFFLVHTRHHLLSLLSITDQRLFQHAYPPSILPSSCHRPKVLSAFLIADQKFFQLAPARRQAIPRFAHPNPTPSSQNQPSPSRSKNVDPNDNLQGGPQHAEWSGGRKYPL